MPLCIRSLATIRDISAQFTPRGLARSAPPSPTRLHCFTRTPEPCEDQGIMASGNVTEILHWYASHQRDLPWRRPDATAWAVLVSEVMLQQTPVARVLPVYEAWLARWPTPASLAAAPAGDAVR